MESCSQHDWEETYYGYTCKRCGLFYAFGCAPWDDPPEFEDSDDYGDYDPYDDYDEGGDEFEEALMNCGQLPDGSCTKAGSEECDWECPFSN